MQKKILPGTTNADALCKISHLIFCVFESILLFTIFSNLSFRVGHSCGVKPESNNTITISQREDGQPEDGSAHHAVDCASTAESNPLIPSSSSSSSSLSLIVSSWLRNPRKRASPAASRLARAANTFPSRSTAVHKLKIASGPTQVVSAVVESSISFLIRSMKIWCGTPASARLIIISGEIRQGVLSRDVRKRSRMQCAGSGGSVVEYFILVWDGRREIRSWSSKGPVLAFIIDIPYIMFRFISV